MRKKLIIVVIVLIIIFGSLYGWHRFIGYKIQQFVSNYKPAPVNVNVVPAKAEQWNDMIEATGSVVARQGVNISPEVAGKIEEIFFTSGEEVKQGEPLVALSHDVLVATLKSNQAQFDLARANYNRELSLYKKHVASKAEFDQFQAQLEQALYTVEQTQAQLDQTLVKAPFAGRLGIRQVNVGQYIQAGTAIVNLETVDPMFVDFAVSENELEHLNVGLPVVISSLAYSDKTFQGRIMAIDSKLSNTARSMMVRAQVPNPDELLKSGMFVSVNVVLPKVDSILTIPPIAVTYTSSIGNYVYVVKAGKAVRTYVTLGSRRGDLVAVTKGLSAGDLVVCAGQNQLKNGSDVVLAKTGEAS